MRNTFRAYERLKREQHIDTLFRTGKAYSVLSLRVIYLVIPRAQGELSPVRLGVSVAKKKFRGAVQRNRIKRLLREAWRLNKQNLYEHIPIHLQLHLFINFTGTELPEYALVNDMMVKAIEKLKGQFPVNQ